MERRKPSMLSHFVCFGVDSWPICAHFHLHTNRYWIRFYSRMFFFPACQFLFVEFFASQWFCSTLEIRSLSCVKVLQFDKNDDHDCSCNGRHLWNDSMPMRHIEMIYYGHLQQCKYFLMVNNNRNAIWIVMSESVFEHWNKWWAIWLKSAIIKQWNEWKESEINDCFCTVAVIKITALLFFSWALNFRKANRKMRTNAH